MLEVIAEDLRPDLVIADRYRLLRKVGEGGMGVVWAAAHVVTGATVALKFLKESRAADPRAHERLLREARAACAVRHPNLVTVHDVLELDSGVPFLVMDLLEGETLAARIAREGALPPAEARALFTTIVDAVAAVHDAGVVHRDLKPENVLLTNDGVKVLDFGIAKHATEQGQEGLTTTGALLGTTAYMAPEQVFGARDLDARADVWALGAMLHEALGGERPIRGENVGEIIRAITQDPIPALSARAVPRDLARLAARMMTRERDARPTLVEVKAALAGAPAPSFGRGWIAAALVALGLGAGGWALAARGGAAGGPAPSASPATSAAIEPASATTTPVASASAPPVPVADPSAKATASAHARPRPLDAGSDATHEAPDSSTIVLTHDRK